MGVNGGGDEGVGEEAGDRSGGAGGRLWPGRPVAAFEGPPLLWVAADGEPVLVTEGGVRYAIASSNASPDAADAPGGTRPARSRDAAELAARLPAGVGLLVDRATSGARIARPAEADRMRPGPVPWGGEPDVAVSAPAREFGPLVALARDVGRRLGAKDVRAAEIVGDGGCRALVIVVRLGGLAGAPAEAALDAIHALVERQAPEIAVRVVAESAVPAGRVAEIRALRHGRDAGGDPAIRGRTPGNVGLAVGGGLAGAFLVGLPNRVPMNGGLDAALTVVGLLVLVGCLGIAIRDFFQQD